MPGGTWGGGKGGGLNGITSLVAGLGAGWATAFFLVCGAAGGLTAAGAASAASKRYVPLAPSIEANTAPPAMAKPKNIPKNDKYTPLAAAAIVDVTAKALVILPVHPMK